MSSLYKKNNNDDLMPKREMFCTRCNVDILTPKKFTRLGSTREKSEDRGYTYLNGDLVCLDCYHKIKGTKKVE